MSVSIFSRRSARVLHILTRLQSGAGLTAAKLAAELGVCRRTVFRDLKTMRQAGFNICYDETLACYRLRDAQGLIAVPAFNREELTTLVAAVHLSVLRNLPGCSDLLSQGVCKLLAKSPRRVQNHALRLVKSCSLLAAENQQPARAGNAVRSIFDAISRRRILRLNVADPDADLELETDFAPYKMVVGAEAWYVVGESSHHGEIRMFDPSHFQQSEVTDRAYAIPQDFRSP